MSGQTVLHVPMSTALPTATAAKAMPSFGPNTFLSARTLPNGPSKCQQCHSWKGEEERMKEDPERPLLLLPGLQPKLLALPSLPTQRALSAQLNLYVARYMNDDCVQGLVSASEEIRGKRNNEQNDVEIGVGKHGRRRAGPVLKPCAASSAVSPT